MTPSQLKDKTLSGGMDKALSSLYGKNLESIRSRLSVMCQEYIDLYGDAADVRIFSAPGRTEIGGNHTDHQHGRVLAASVNMDVLCLAAANSSGVIRIKSQGYPMDKIDLDILTVLPQEKNTAASMIRGVAAWFNDQGYSIGGFDAYTASNVLKGSGLSSSAAFEVAVGTMLNGLYNSGSVSPVEIAKAGQYAENKFCGKPSGLMDQTASSVGGFVTIDFKNPTEPVVESVDFDFAGSGYDLCVVDTGGSHSDLTHEYASMPKEMGDIAKFLGADVLRDTDETQFYKRMGEARKVCGDRAVLRAMHFYGDNARVPKQVEALRQGDLPEFLRLIKESGRSSQNLLQNIFACSEPQEQGLNLALAISEEILKDKGAWRVHGGGIAGTILAFVPKELTAAYTQGIEDVFGENSVYVLSIRPVGGTEIFI